MNKTDAAIQSEVRVLALALGLALVSSGCDFLGSLGKSDGAAMNLVAASAPAGSGACMTAGAGFAAFQSQFYPLAATNCVSCHKAIQNPFFAVSDATSAYQAAKPYLSAFSGHLTNGHCGLSFCMAGSTVSNQMLAALSTWQAAENAPVCSPSSTPSTGPSGTSSPTSAANQFPPPAATANVVSGSIPVPTTATSTDWVLLRFDLSGSKPANPDLAGVVLELQIQLHGNNAYVFRTPRLATPVNPILVQNLQIMVNGNYDPLTSQMWDVQSTVAPSNAPIPAPSVGSLPFPELSAKTVLVAQGAGPGNDQISVAFQTLQKSSPVACKALSYFQSQVQPVITNKCAWCHDSGTAGYSAAAAAAWPIHGLTADQLCAGALQRIDRSNPMLSPLIADPLTRTNGHPLTSPYAAYTDIAGKPMFLPTDLPPFISWIDQEK